MQKIKVRLKIVSAVVGLLCLARIVRQQSRVARATTHGTTMKRGDLNNDKVEIVDLGVLLSYWGNTVGPEADFNQYGAVDFGVLIGN